MRESEDEGLKRARKGGTKPIVPLTGSQRLQSAARRIGVRNISLRGSPEKPRDRRSLHAE